MDFAFDARTEELREQLLDFMDEHVYPAEAVFARAARGAGRPVRRGTPPPVLEELARRGPRRAGLWNLFLPGASTAPG